MTQQFGTPSIEDLVDRGPVVQPEDPSMICRYEYVPGLLLIFVVAARDRDGPPQISYVVVLFASHIKAYQVTRAHILVQVVVSRERSKRPREYGIVSRHCPRPEGDAVCAHAPACVFDRRFDAPLRYTWSNCPHSGHYGSHSRLRSRAQSSSFLRTLNCHKGLDSFPRFFSFKGGPPLQNDLQPNRSLRRLRAEKVGWQFGEC